MSPPRIVGIGASAGGLNSLLCFLGALPADFAFALVFVQHLSSRHKSLLPDLLQSRRSDIEVIEIADGLEVLAGRLYICPPGRDVHIRKGTFHLVLPPEQRLHLPIDEFFVSLSEDAGEKATVVIFSGAGTDGARGLRAVRAMGGTVFVQDPATAEFPGMPSAAIGTGQADMVLPPDEIAREIVKAEAAELAQSGDELIGPAGLDSLLQLVYEKTGYRLDHYKKNIVSRRVARRMQLYGMTSASDYLSAVVEKETEASVLASDIMIGVTSFFRDRVAWKALRMEAIRKFAAGTDASPLRVWAPACATGEEVYSLTMMISNELELAGNRRDVHVFATDINDRAIEKAREGKYPGSIAADVPPDLMRRYFTCSEDGLSVVINKEIRERVVFARQDLLADPPFSRLDLIICRNLMIYLDPAAQEKCLALFHYALNDGGYLFLGNAESTSRDSTLFKNVGHKKCRIYRKVESEESARPPLPIAFTVKDPAPHPQQQTAERGESLTLRIQEALLEGYAPAAVAVDRNYDILYHNGPTSRYLRQPRGAPTQHLLELLPEAVRSRMRGALYRAAGLARPVSVRTSIVGDDGRKRQVTLRVTKLREDIILIVFREKGKLSDATEAAPAESPGCEEAAVLQLESELSATREALHSNIEQLKGLNEELQSSNEELHAANEELETSREELQSLNEELITVNSQLQIKIEEQEETNNDLNNFQASTSIPTLFLDHEFKVRRFTPAMSELIKLIPADMGRPISDMSAEGLGPDLVEDAHEVLVSLIPIKREVATGNTWYIRTALPYRTSDNRIEGVVITYNNITELKAAQERTGHLASFPQLNPNPVLEVSSSGKVTFANPGSERILEDLGMEKTDARAFLPRDLDIILNELRKKEEATFYREIPIKDKIFAASVQLVPQFDVVRIYERDITERKRVEESLRGNEGRLRRTQEIAHLGSWELDLVANVLTWSDEVYRIFGIEPQAFDATYEAFLGVVHPEDRAAVDAAYSGSLKAGRNTYEIEHRVVRKSDGEIRYVHEKCEHFRDDGGRIVRSVGMVHDITERKLAEMALGASEAKYRSLFENMISGFAFHKVVTDEAGKPIDYVFLEVNPAFEKLTALKREHIIGKRVTEALPGIEKDPADWIGTYGKVALTRREIRFEQYAASLNKWFAVSAYSPMKDHFAAVFEDITERKQAETILQRMNEELENLVADRTRLYSILARTNEAIVRIRDQQSLFEEVCRVIVQEGSFKLSWVGLLDDESGEVRPVASCGSTEYLHGIRVLTGNAPEAQGPTGRAVTEGRQFICSDIEEDRCMLPWRDRARAHKLRSSAAFPLRVGDRVFGALTIYSDKPSFFIEEEVSLLLSLAEDLSFAIDSIETEGKRREAEEDLRVLNEELELRVQQRTTELENANRELEAFIYSVSHDLRAPLRSMSGFAKIIETDYADVLDARGKDYLARIGKGAVKMNRLIEDLLDLSKVSRKELRRTTADLSAIASSIVSDLCESDPARSVEISLAPGLTASADLQLMEVVLSNLLGNAWKFTSKTEAARIEFGAEEQDGSTVYYVRDNGAGYDPRYTEKIFWPFQRLHSENEFEGTGIGLAIVERVIRRHGGKIWTEGETGKGATFFFTLA